MLPTLRSGQETIIYKAFPFKKLRIGDIVIINYESYSIIHRIVDKERFRKLITKGDNNKYKDSTYLSPKNYGGLAITDETVRKYRKHINSKS